MFWRWIAVGVASFLASSAAAQTTKPSEIMWPKTMDTFAKSLVSGDATALASVLQDNAAIRAFDTQSDDVQRLLARVSKGTLIGAHAYIHKPLAMAADLANDFKVCPIVPDDVKKKMIPAEDQEMQRANATAVQWLADVLGAKDGDAVGVVVLWVARPSTTAQPSDSPPSMEACFVLVKAEETAPNSNQYKIKQIVFGDPTP